MGSLQHAVGLSCPVEPQFYSATVQKKVDAFVAKYFHDPAAAAIDTQILSAESEELSSASDVGTMGLWAMPSIGTQHTQQQQQQHGSAAMAATVAAGQHTEDLPVPSPQQLLAGDTMAAAAAAAAAALVPPGLVYQASTAVQLAPCAFLPPAQEVWAPQAASPFMTATVCMQQGLHEGIDADEDVGDLAEILEGIVSEDYTDVSAGPPQLGPLAAVQQHSPQQVLSSALSAAAGSSTPSALRDMPWAPYQAQSGTPTTAMLAASPAAVGSSPGPTAAAWSGAGSGSTIQELVLTNCGEVVLFVDISTQHMLQLYTTLAALQPQHAGMAAITWMAGVRSSLSTACASSSSAGAGAVLSASVAPAVLHTCASLVAVGAADVQDTAAAGQSFCWSFLLPVLEQVMGALMSLRTLCAAFHPMQGFSSDMQHAWQRQLQGTTSTQEGPAVAAVLNWLVDS